MITLVTGVGARGQVGEAVAYALARRGDTVLLVSRGADDVRERAADLTRSGLRAAGYGCDLTDPDAVQRLGRAIRGEHGERLDALVNLAGGFAMTGPLAESDIAGSRRLVDINFTTALLATREFLPMLRAARGSAVYFASDRVLEGARTAEIAAYTAAKAAVVALMRSVADEGSQHGVRANALAPGSIRTATNEASMGADAKYVEREHVAAVVEFLCSQASRAITGQVIRLRA